MRYKQKICCICALSLLLLACSGDNEDLVHYIAEVKQRKTKDLDPFPSFAPLPAFIFPDNIDRRSPFKQVIQNKEADPNEPDTKRPKQPLEVFPIDALRFVGTLRQGNEIWALIQKPDKEITYVKVGNYIGQNYGRIISIKTDSMQLLETTKSSGKWRHRTTTIELYTGKQE